MLDDGGDSGVTDGDFSVCHAAVYLSRLYPHRDQFSGVLFYCIIST